MAPKASWRNISRKRRAKGIEADCYNPLKKRLQLAAICGRFAVEIA